MSAAHLSTGMTARRSNSSRDFIELSLDSNLFLQLQALSPCQGRSELQCQECVILNVDSIMDPRTQKQETLLTGFPARYTGARSSITIPIQAHLPGSVDRLRPIRASSTETSKSILIKFHAALDANKEVVGICPCCQRFAVNVHALALFAPFCGQAGQYNNRARARRYALTQGCPL